MGGEDLPIGCEWAPPIQSKGQFTGSATLSREGSCHFRRKVNVDNHREPYVSLFIVPKNKYLIQIVME